MNVEKEMSRCIFVFASPGLGQGEPVGARCSVRGAVVSEAAVFDCGGRCSRDRGVVAFEGVGVGDVGYGLDTAWQ